MASQFDSIMAGKYPNCEACNGKLQIGYDDYDDIIQTICYEPSCIEYKKINTISR